MNRNIRHTSHVNDMINNGKQAEFLGKITLEDSILWRLKQQNAPIVVKNRIEIKKIILLQN